MPDEKLINIVHAETGKRYAVPEADVPDAVEQGFHVESSGEAVERVQRGVVEKELGGTGGAVAAGVLGGLRGATFGASDALLGGGEDIAALRELHPYASIGTELAGGLVTGGGGIAARAGRVAADASSAAKVAAAARGFAAEGAVAGVGQGVSELALSNDPLTFERIASVIGTNATLGAGIGGVLGAGGKGLELGLRRAKGALDKIAAGRADPAAAIGDDLAKLDAKGLRAAEKAEQQAIETARVTQRSEIADEVRALRREMKDSKIWLATKDDDVKAIKEVREVGKVALEADKAIDRMLRNPKALSQRPQRVLDGLQQQEHALERLVAQGDNLRPIYAKDASTARQAAFDYASTALEKNRALQAKIADVTATPTSARLDAIGAARDALNVPQAGPGMGGLLGDYAVGHVLGAAAGVPFLGPAVAAARAVGGVIKKIGGLNASQAARASQAVDTFLNVGKKVAPRVPVMATKVLGSVSYASQPKQQGQAATPGKLPDLYRERVAEIRSHVIPGPDGKLEMRPQSRDDIAAKLAPIRAANPLLADHIETVHARGVVFLADKAPKKPEPFGMQLGGPDKWQPSDLEMRTWARYVAAVNDPYGVVERLAHGSVTPEDAETMKTVYPEMYADIQRQIIEKLPTLQKQLPYQKRLAMSVFSGIPVDPAMHPAVLAILQQSHGTEEGTEGGVQAPRAEPAFGSVTKPEPTSAQERGA